MGFGFIDFEKLVLLAADAEQVSSPGSIDRNACVKIIGTTSTRMPELIAAMMKLGFKNHLELGGIVLESQ